MNAIIEVNDIFNELKEENNKLSQSLQLSKKCFILLEKYRNYLNCYKNKCKCDLNIINNDFNELENEYNLTLSQINENKTIETNVGFERNESEDNYWSDTDIEDNSLSFLRENKLNDKKESISNIDNNQNINNYIDFDLNQTESEVKKVNELKTKPKKKLKSIHKKDRDYVLSDCESQLGSDYEKRINKREKISKNKWINCEYNECDYRTKFKDKLKKHSNEVHKDKSPTLCNRCQRSYWTKNSWSAHRQWCCNGLEFLCKWSECVQAFKTRWQFEKHMCEHRGERPFTCQWPGCESSFINKYKLKKHYFNVHSDEKLVVCEWPGCESKFKNEDYLKRHRMIHSGVKPFVCNINECGKRFLTNAKLRRHHLTHTKHDKRFECFWPSCEEVFKSQNKCDQHLLQHQLK